MTRDHTLVQRLVDEGNLDEAEAATHPWRNVVLRSVNGTLAETGDVTMLRLAARDRVLLTSDGLTDLVSETHIVDLLNEHHGQARGVVPTQGRTPSAAG